MLFQERMKDDNKVMRKELQGNECVKWNMNKLLLHTIYFTATALI